MTWAVLTYILQVVVALGAVTTSIAFAGMYCCEGETDKFGERIGPPHPIGVVGHALVGLLAWLPLLPVLSFGA